MASSPENNASPSVQKVMRLESSQGKKSQHAEEAIFYMNCRAAYLTVFKSSLENIKSKEQLSLVLQQAGRNPCQKTVNKYWTSQTTTLNFDDFCTILKKEKPATKTELLEAFGKIDTDNTGYILHDELYKILTTRGEKMTRDEVSAIIKQADFNCSGKLDYNKFCDLYMTTSEQCCKTAREKLEVDCRLRQQQFGNQAELSSEGITLPVSKPSPRISRKTDHKLAPTKGDSRTPSRPSSAQSCKASISTTISMGASSNRNTKLIEPDTMKEWQWAQSKGCFYLEEDGEIVSHKYKLHLPQRSTVCITIKPLNVRQVEGKSYHWLSVDTALYILKENETQENLQLVSFTEQQNKEMFGWKGELGSGVYWLLPFTTGCRLKKVKPQIAGEAKLVYRGEDGELALTKDFRAALLDIFETIDLDGNGLLSLEEYNFFELRTSGEKCDEEAWAVCKENFDMKKNELTRQGFMDLNLMEANDREGDPSDLWVTLLSLGYNKALEMTEACPFVIDIYAEKCKPRIKAIYLEAGSSQLNRAICKSVVNKGEAKVMDGCENIIIHTYKAGRRITSVIENKSENKVIIHVNNEQSKNCLSNRGLTVFAVEVAPKSMMVSQHVMPLNEQEEWLYNCVHSLLR
ncbi:EF-hand calcium-binding domain-containing protein 7 isoform X2 [Haliaeetus albicilla]|uniref:EF-hand calcium-binding domain-containing protein 7 n=3 Tax=Haliaeetus TaxID=8968 RepID=A0A091P0J2_HALAL|nr:PREDICTED: EF-hand calcium-binding domain-containing protein 7 [Haliaeetus albicilla]XP_010580593.1 PREDICTED: EF-hand calcium-binding domain-containing protein 7 isoform X1 [Haliaeetus leucocephalus]KFQ01103.1 EF-hand calcium-binding domain-containing protein 7 [Haliaeetus albicilla]